MHSFGRLHSLTAAGKRYLGLILKGTLTLIRLSNFEGQTFLKDAFISVIKTAEQRPLRATKDQIKIHSKLVEVSFSSSEDGVSCLLAKSACCSLLILQSSASALALKPPTEQLVKSRSIELFSTKLLFANSVYADNFLSACSCYLFFNSATFFL